MGRKRKRERRNQIGELTVRWNEIETDIREVEVALRGLPVGTEKTRLTAMLSQVKRELGLLPEPPPNPREHWTWDRWEARAIQLKTEARAWRSGGHTERADACLREAEVAAKRARELKSLEPPRSDRD